MLLYVPAEREAGADLASRATPTSPSPGTARTRSTPRTPSAGPKLLVQTVEQATGLRIDGYLEIGFGGFVDVIDAVGGIRMCLPSAIKDTDATST